MSLADELRFIAAVARDAGKIALDHYGRVERLTKTHVAASDEAVSVADREVQRHIVAALAERFPGDGIIGEEDDRGEGITFRCHDPAGRNWVIDPIDGTNNFLAGLGHFAVCIGLLDRGEPVLGVVYDVTHGAMYAAARGCGATLNDRPIRVRETPLSSASMIMMTSNVIDKTGRCPRWAEILIGQTTWKIRILGSAAIEAVQVAAGVAHAAITVNGKLWDCVAPAAIVRESGGIVSGLLGQAVFPFDLNDYQGAKLPFIAAAPAAHAQLVDEIRLNP